MLAATRERGAIIASMAFAFRLTETMTGLHHFVDPTFGSSDERPCWFRVDWGEGLGATIRDAIARRPLVNALRGTISVEGLTSGEVACEGTLTLDYLAARRLRYELAFEARGRAFTLRADKRDVELRRPLALIKTHTTAYLEVRDADGHVVSRGVLHFRPESLGAFVRSAKLVRSSRA